MRENHPDVPRDVKRTQYQLCELPRAEHPGEETVGKTDLVRALYHAEQIPVWEEYLLRDFGINLGSQ